MIKVVSPSSFDFGQAAMSLMAVHSRGVDNGWLRKSAAVLTKDISEIRPEPGTTFVHLIALGDAESYGGNRNGDLFPKAANEKYHSTFVKRAKWFHNHKNKPDRGDKVYGYVKASAYNPEMHRVELVVGISEKDDPDSIEKLARGEDLPVSMACTVPHDTCTICGNQAKNAAQYCRCIKEACTQLADDGKFIGMINDDPSFFDISKVNRNADRIAFSLRKVASHGNNIMLSADVANMYGITEPVMLVKDARYYVRLNNLRKLATMEKEVEGEMTQNPSLGSIASALNCDVPGDLEKIPEDKLKPVLGALASARVSLPLTDFFRLVLGSRFSELEKDMPAAEAALPGVFSRACENPDEFLSGVDNYSPSAAGLPACVQDILKKVIPQASLEAGPIGGRVTTIVLRKHAAVLPHNQLKSQSAVGKMLAEEYARYKVAMLDWVDDPFVVKMAVLQHFGI